MVSTALAQRRQSLRRSSLIVNRFCGVGRLYRGHHCRVPVFENTKKTRVPDPSAHDRNRSLLALRTAPSSCSAGRRILKYKLTVPTSDKKVRCAAKTAASSSPLVFCFLFFTAVFVLPRIGGGPGGDPGPLFAGPGDPGPLFAVRGRGAFSSRGVTPPPPPATLTCSTGCT